MGKHDKTIVAEINPIEFYKERNRTLAAENTRLRERILELERAAGIAELAMEHQEVVSAGISNELKEVIEEKDAQIAELKYENEKLKDRLIREVLK